ncbi:hypothetical protein SCAR479_00290 [Seiridium cardinale]|uniref:histone acetyltransferase n=1 Tax=Seiridium cardinale TaxID=138064 RepID=A0ABR2Y928_9PEZI
MASGVLNGDAQVGSDGPRQKSKATPDTIRAGCIAMVEKGGQARRAEILSIKDTKSGRQFYCNFDNFNKRLDEWVPVKRIDFEQDVEWPNPDKDKPKDGKNKKASTAPKKTAVAKKAQKRPGKREQSVTSEAVTPHPWTDFVDSQPPSKAPSTPRDLEMKAGETPTAGPDYMDMDDDEATPGIKKEEEEFSREAEIEKLRTGGSMTQNPTELARIRNISKVQFGRYDLFPWYFSPYPEMFTQEDVIYICEFCLMYYGEQKSFHRHRAKCTLQHPPGNEIYRDDYVSFFEIDGRRQRTWCRNLCLISKMFLDHKTLYYDVDPFLFYVMTQKSEKGQHLVGYFSKEKESADGYNVACILTLPQYQRKGFGRLLIQFSYELSKIEGKLGSPEKPLSDLGLLSYRQYWSENMLDLLLDNNDRDERVSIESISTALAMTTQDVEHTLQALKMQVYHKGEHKLVIPEKMIHQREKSKLKQKHLIDPDRIQWKPPVFTASSRTWGCTTPEVLNFFNIVAIHLYIVHTLAMLKSLRHYTFTSAPLKATTGRRPQPCSQPRRTMATTQPTKKPPGNASHLDTSNSSLKPINLLRGWPAPSLLPASALQKASAAVLSDPAISVPALQYGPDPGYQPLRENLASWLSGFYGTQETADRIAITGGASQSVACVLQSYTDPSYTRAVWMVAPCYFLACPIFRDSGFDGRLRAVPEDNEGIDLEYLEREIEKLEKGGSDDGRGEETKPVYKDPTPYRKIYKHVIYCVPSFSNPSGKTMSLARRRGLVELARKWDALVVCDDVYDMLQWPIISSSSSPSPTESGHPSVLKAPILPRLVDIDTQLGPSPHDPSGQHFGHAISNGSFSKLVGPGMRTGWVDATPDFTLGISQTGSTRSGGAPSQFGATMLCELLKSGELDHHIEEKLKPNYQRRHSLMADTIQRVLVPLGAKLRFSSLEGDKEKDHIFGGYFLWMHFPEGPSAKLISDRCREENLAVGHGELFEVQGDEKAVRLENDMRLCFAWEDEDDLVEGVERLGRAVEAVKKGGDDGITKGRVEGDKKDQADEFK